MIFLKNIGPWLRSRKFSDYFFAAILVFFLATRLPMLIEQYTQQGSVISPISLEGQLFPPPGAKSVLVFWASWCGPCSVELKRIKAAIEKKEISPRNIFAVNLGESENVVNKAIKEKELNMPVVLDKNGSLANILKVEVTPTIVFIDEKGKIDWISSGLSPSLIYRIKNFLGE